MLKIRNHKIKIIRIKKLFFFQIINWHDIYYLECVQPVFISKYKSFQKQLMAKFKKKPGCRLLKHHDPNFRKKDTFRMSILIIIYTK